MNYSDISPEFTAKFFELASVAKRIIIAGHRSPDDDAISSALAVYEIIGLKTPGVEVRIIFTALADDRYKSFKNFDRIEFVQDLANEVTPDDLLVVVDGSQLYRFSEQPEKLAQVKTKICIDHHSSPIDDFTLSLVAPKYPAAAEVVYRALCGDVQVSKELAEVFLLGILGDTGTFAYLKPSQSETFTLAKQLLEISQVQIQEFLSRYETIRLRSFEIFKELTKNTQFGKAQGWPDFQYTFVNEEFVKAGGYNDIELTEASALYKDSYVRKIAGYPWGFVIKPTSSSEVSVSARSLPGSVNVRDLMERMNLGGGHDRAAGGSFKTGTVQQATDAILGWLSKNKPTLS